MTTIAASSYPQESTNPRSSGLGIQSPPYVHNRILDFPDPPCADRDGRRPEGHYRR